MPWLPCMPGGVRRGVLVAVPARSLAIEVAMALLVAVSGLLLVVVKAVAAGGAAVGVVLRPLVVLIGEGVVGERVSGVGRPSLAGRGESVVLVRLVSLVVAWAVVLVVGVVVVRI